MAFDPASLLGGYTQLELEAAFNLVCNKENWKLPIKAELPSILSAEKRKLIAFAIGFYTGSETSFGKTAGGKLLVSAPGYYVAVGA